MISPEQRLANVAKNVRRLTTPTRHISSRDPNYAASKAEIATAAAHLADLVEQYLRGDLAAIPNNDIPF